MGDVARAWHWLHGRAPLGALPDRPAPVALAWCLAGGIALLVEALSPLASDPRRVLVPLVGELALVAVVFCAVARARPHVPAMQGLHAAGLLAAVRTLVLAPVLLVLASARAPSGVVLAVFVLVALVTVAAMAWLVRRYLLLWREALQLGPRASAGLLLALAAALLLIEAALA